MPEYNRQPVFPVIMVAAGVVFILGAIFWSLSLGRSQDVVSAVAPRIPFSNIERIGVEEAKAAFDRQEAIFLDTRGDPYFAGGHIPGAVSMTVDEVGDRIQELDRSRWIITYCT